MPADVPGGGATGLAAIGHNARMEYDPMPPSDRPSSPADRSAASGPPGAAGAEPGNVTPRRAGGFGR